MRRHPPTTLASVVAVAALALPAGCGGGSPRLASLTASTAAASTTRTIAGTVQQRALSFARCMRAHGIPGWPDPDAAGRFDKSKMRQLGLSISRVQALEAGPCSQLDAPGSPAATITAADRADYLKAAACMRVRGFPSFPDPTFQGNDVTLDIPSSIDTNSSKYQTAATTCTKVIPAGLPHSRPSGS